MKKLVAVATITAASLGVGHAEAAYKSPYTSSGGRLACQALGSYTTSYGNCAHPNGATTFCANILTLSGYGGPKDNLAMCNAVNYGYRYA